MEKNLNPLLSLSEKEKTTHPKHDYFFLCVDGIGGKGKTVMLTMLAVLLHKNYNKVYANFELYGVPNFERLPKRLTKHIILSLESDSLVLLTEAYLYFDNRECMKAKNIQNTHAFFQARKKGMDIFFDIPSFKYTELRLKEWTKIILRAKGRVGEGERERYIFSYDICTYSVDADMLVYRKLKRKFNMKEFFKHFKSFEIIDCEPTLKAWGDKNEKK